MVQFVTTGVCRQKRKAIRKRHNDTLEKRVEGVQIDPHVFLRVQNEAQ